MKFLIQKKLIDENDLDIFILLNKLKSSHLKYLHSVYYSDIGNIDTTIHSGMIPIGDINFVTEYVNKIYGVDHEIPIEIPKALQKYKFLKRDYSIVSWDEVPKEGNWFIKDVSRLKVFSYSGDLRFLEGCWDEQKEYSTALTLARDHLYQVSEVVDILAEYRVYIIGGNIESIVQYDGDPCIKLDTDLIKEAHEVYKRSGECPKSYTMDVMVTPRGTSIIEIHNFTSVGLYTTLFSDNLLYAYRDGLDFILNNKIKEIEKVKITKTEEIM